MQQVIYQVILGRIHYWNTCGWTPDVRRARVYSPGECKTAFRRMSRDGIRCVIATL